MKIKLITAGVGLIVALITGNRYCYRNSAYSYGNGHSLANTGGSWHRLPEPLGSNFERLVARSS